MSRYRPSRPRPRALALAPIAGLALALSLAPSPWAAQEIINWLLGSLADRSADDVWRALPFIVVGSGLMLFLGTMFVPTKDRAGPGEGFTHREGDIVRVSSPRLGGLINHVTTSDRAPPWTFGTRALMASLAARGDPAEELAFAASLLDRVLAAAGSTRTGLHVCRGNWSRDEATLLSGGYAPLAAWFEQRPVTQLVLEYATPRAGDLIAPGDKELGLGVVNPRTAEVEAAADVIERAEQALRWVPPHRLFLNPDCGFGTFAGWEWVAEDVVWLKLKTLREGADIASKQLWN